MSLLEALRAKRAAVSASLIEDQSASPTSTAIEPPLPPRSIALPELLHQTDCQSLWSFGNNTYGRLGTSATDHAHRSTPAMLTSLAGFDIAMMACGAGHNAVLAKPSTPDVTSLSLSSSPLAWRVYTWGKCHFGQLGRASLDQDESYPSVVPNLSFDAIASPPSASSTERNTNHTNQVYDIACGESHVLVACDRGVYAFGCGFNGALGLGSESACSLPTVIPHLSPEHCQASSTCLLSQSDRIVSVAAGQAHSIACSKSGIVCASNSVSHSLARSLTHWLRTRPTNCIGVGVYMGQEPQRPIGLGPCELATTDSKRTRDAGAHLQGC
jgi:alpha-tubulin suppressor-like RCC1 family protein